MPVTFGELSTLTTPLSVARLWALLCGCLTFSLASFTVPEDGPEPPHLNTFRLFCMTSWCLFFILTFLILAINFIQFHSLLPLSWKNLTATVAAMAALMTAAATFAFPYILTEKDSKVVQPRQVAAAATSLLTSLAYVVEVQLIRTQGGEQQRGYMATVPGLLKTLQVFGGCVALMLLIAQTEAAWRVGISAAAYALCLLASLCTVLVMVKDCAGRSPVPFDRLLAAFSLLGVIVYMVATVICFTRALNLDNTDETHDANVPVISETAVACLTLLAYTVDLAFSVKMLCDRN